MKKGDKVLINIGYKTVSGVIVDEVDDNSDYISVKHDNFRSELFNKNQVINL